MVPFLSYVPPPALPVCLACSWVPSSFLVVSFRGPCVHQSFCVGCLSSPSWLQQSTHSAAGVKKKSRTWGFGLRGPISKPLLQLTSCGGITDEGMTQGKSWMLGMDTRDSVQHCRCAPPGVPSHSHLSCRGWGRGSSVTSIESKKREHLVTCMIMKERAQGSHMMKKPVCWRGLTVWGCPGVFGVRMG